MVCHRHAETRLQVGFKSEVEKTFNRRNPLLGRDINQPAFGELRPSGHFGDDRGEESGFERFGYATVELRPHAFPKIRIGIQNFLARVIGGRDRAEHAHRFKHERGGELVFEIQRSGGHLGYDRVPFRDEFLRGEQLFRRRAVVDRGAGE